MLKPFSCLSPARRGSPDQPGRRALALDQRIGEKRRGVHHALDGGEGEPLALEQMPQPVITPSVGSFGVVSALWLQ